MPTTVTLKTGSTSVLQVLCKDGPTTDSQTGKQSLLLPPRVTCSLLLPQTSKDLGTLSGSMKRNQHSYAATEVKDLVWKTLLFLLFLPQAQGVSYTQKIAKSNWTCLEVRRAGGSKAQRCPGPTQDVCEPWEPASDAE